MRDSVADDGLAQRGKLVRPPLETDRQLFSEFCDALDDASLMGSLVRLERLVQQRVFGGELKAAIDAYVHRKAADGVDESYFEGESAKGLRLLDVLNRRYDVVFTNPPYMSSRNMNSAMSDTPLRIDSGVMPCSAL